MLFVMPTEGVEGIVLPPLWTDQEFFENAGKYCNRYTQRMTGTVFEWADYELGRMQFAMKLYIVLLRFLEWEVMFDQWCDAYVLAIQSKYVWEQDSNKASMAFTNFMAAKSRFLELRPIINT